MCQSHQQADVHFTHHLEIPSAFDYTMIKRLNNREKWNSAWKVKFAFSPLQKNHTDSGMQKITLRLWADLIQKFLIGQLEVSTMGDGSIDFIHLASKDSNTNKIGR